jgi:hypothetical protein
MQRFTVHPTQDGFQVRNRDGEVVMEGPKWQVEDFLDKQENELRSELLARAKRLKFKKRFTLPRLCA